MKGDKERYPNLIQDVIDGTRAQVRIWAKHRRRGKEATVKALARHIRRRLAARKREERAAHEQHRRNPPTGRTVRCRRPPPAT